MEQEIAARGGRMQTVRKTKKSTAWAALFHWQRLCLEHSSIFWEKLEKYGKVIDLSLLPSRQTSLELHSRRASFVARMWRNASNLILSLDHPSNGGWLADMTINWTEEAYPEEIPELLIEDINISMVMMRKR